VLFIDFRCHSTGQLEMTLLSGFRKKILYILGDKVKGF